MRIPFILYVIISMYSLFIPMSSISKDIIVSPHNTFEQTHKQLALSDLLEPINLTPEGIRFFLQSVYSHPLYVDVLPHSFFHMHQLLDYGTPSNQMAYRQSTIRLFSNRLKTCTYVNPSALISLLETLPVLLKTQEKPSVLQNEQETIVDLLYQQFLSDFKGFKADPDAFFSDLAQKITDSVVQKQITTTHELMSLQTSLLSFLEISINKLIWSPQDQEKTWNTVKTIARHLDTLAHEGFITNQDYLCDLFITLTERYRFFVELMHESLSVAFFTTVRTDIATHSYALLNLEEQEKYIESRKDRLIRSLEICEARARAREYPARTPQVRFSEEREQSTTPTMLDQPDPFGQKTSEKDTSKKSRKRRRRQEKDK